MTADDRPGFYEALARQTAFDAEASKRVSDIWHKGWDPFADSVTEFFGSVTPDDLDTEEVTA